MPFKLECPFDNALEVYTENHDTKEHSLTSNVAEAFGADADLRLLLRRIPSHSFQNWGAKQKSYFWKVLEPEGHQDRQQTFFTLKGHHSFSIRGTLGHLNMATHRVIIGLQMFAVKMWTETEGVQMS